MPAHKTHRAHRASRAGVTTVALAAEHLARNILPLIPMGSFRASDGRPDDAPAWTLTPAGAQRIKQRIESRAAAGTRMVIDYEHQTLLAKTNGQPAPAAAWVSKVEVIDGALCSIDTDFTERARAHIAAGEYGYVSPVFAYDKSGEVLMLAHASFTNTPALDGMGIAALSSALADFPLDFNSMGALMDELLARLRTLLNLNTAATAEDISAALAKLTAELGDADALVAVAALKSQIATLRTAVPDPARFVPIAVHSATVTELAELRRTALAAQVEDLVAPALADGRLLPAQEAWARGLGASNLAALSEFLSKALPNPALAGTQTGGKKPDGSDAKTLTEAQLAVCARLGVSQEAYLAAL
jgi:phage I-like protein